MFEDIASAAASTEYQPEAIADSTQILHLIESRLPSPPLFPQTRGKQAETWMLLEDWLDESTDIASRFVYYDFRVGTGKQIDPSVLSQFSDLIGAAPVRY